MANKRTQRTSEEMRSALLRLLETKPLASISVSDVAREAGVSRSTFYCHYGNVMDVYESVVEDFLGGVASLRAQLKGGCGNGCRNGGVPFCEAVRSEKKYQGATKDPLFLDCVLAKVSGVPASGELNPYMDLGLTPEQAKTLMTFQMAGCYAALRGFSEEGDWSGMRDLIDTFIAGGMRAVKDKAAL